MATILERAIDARVVVLGRHTERGDAIAATALAMGEVPMLRAFIVKVKRKNETRVIFEAMGFDSCSVTAQHADLCEAGEYLVVTPRCRSVFAETATDYAQRRARENDQQAARLQMIDLDAMRCEGAL